MGPWLRPRTKLLGGEARIQGSTAGWFCALARSLLCCRTPCAAASSHGTFEVTKRLECASLLALKKRHRVRRPTSPRPPFHKRPDSLGEPTTHSMEGLVPPVWGWMWTPTAGLGLRTAELCLQSSLPPAAAEVAGGREKAETRPRVGRFPAKGCNSAFEPPSTFPQFVPVGAAGALTEQAFLWGLLLSAAKKVKRAQVTLRTLL